MSGPWEQTWDAVNDAFGRVAGELSASNPALWWVCGHTDNEVFPFRAYAAFNSAGVAGEEDIVVSLDFQRSPGTLAFRSDISRGSGEIVADGPSGELSLATDVATVRAWIEQCTTEFIAFLIASRSLLMLELTDGVDLGESLHEP